MDVFVERRRSLARKNLVRSLVCVALAVSTAGLAGCSDGPAQPWPDISTLSSEKPSKQEKTARDESVKKAIDELEKSGQTHRDAAISDIERN